MNFDRYIDIAKALKPVYQTGKSFHLSVVLKGSKVIVIGINRYDKANPISATYLRTKHHINKPYNSGIHSEQFVLGKLKYSELDGLTLVNVRINNLNELAYSAPCSNCSYHLGLSRKFKSIWYSTSNGFEKLNSLN